VSALLGRLEVCRRAWAAPTPRVGQPAGQCSPALGLVPVPCWAGLRPSGATRLGHASARPAGPLRRVGHARPLGRVSAVPVVAAGPFSCLRVF